MVFLKKLIKNKVIVLSISVIVVSLVYAGVQRAIDNYNFNNDIITEGENETSETFNMGNSSESTSNKEDVESEISNEETNLALEETEEEVTDTEETGLQELNNKETIGKIYVYITGEVNNPGVVILNEGSRIVDAINAAGGTTAKANVSKVNLVYVLDDGMKVNIPNGNDLKNNSDFQYITMNSGDGVNDDYSDRDYSSGTSSTAGTGTAIDNSESNKRYDIVNINTATQTELETLPGIGPSLALKIIKFRKENGSFSSIEQIKDVSGIGESKFENLKNYITI